jgi:hypothetical protein
MDEVSPFTLLGILLILLGVIFIALPHISQFVNIDKIPWIILYIYRREGFTFATSPLLLILSAISLLIAYAHR